MVLVATKMALSLTTGVTSANQVAGTFLYNNQKGILKLYALGSATGLTLTCMNNGQTIAIQQPVPFFGTTGTLSKIAHEVFVQGVNPGLLELYFTNPTGGTLTVDFILELIYTK